VVEVGVDVGLASLVVIMNAERFGLSALHQIRGRVGRNNFAINSCVMLTQKEFVRSKRLGYLCQYQDGFTLAQKDLELRGAGDMIGSTQSGFGDEVESMVGLNPDLYSKIASLVDGIDVATLPRLKIYLDKEKNRVWEE
jgi:RecG-like helicase